MIFRVQIGDDVNVLLDDELTEERPTPEICRDYLRACMTTACDTYTHLATTADITTAEDD